MRLTRLLLLGVLAAPALFAADPLPVWQTDWNTAFRMAREQHRLVLVDYVTNACKPCHDIETISFKQPEVMKRFSGFVLLRVDVGRNAVPQAHREYNPPVYVVFDPDERERYRIDDKNLAALYPRGWGRSGPKEVGQSDELDRFREAAPAFLHAAELFDAKQDLEASFLVARIYNRLKMTARTRDAYAEAERSAQSHGDPAAAQLAAVQSAFTYAYDGDPTRAITLLRQQAQKPVNRDNEGMTWLTIGHAYELAKDPKSALDAYQHAQTTAPPESRTFAEAGQAMARLQ
jgi:hypothetical protein